MEKAEMRIANQLGELESVRQWVEGFGAAHALPTRVLTALLVSFDEVLNNLISYGYSDSDRHEICLRLSLARGEVWAEVEDDAAAFDPLGAAAPDLSGGITGREPGGLGIHFLKTLNDEVQYRRLQNRNRLRFKKCVDQQVSKPSA